MLMFRSPLPHTGPSFEPTSNGLRILRGRQEKLTLYPVFESTCSNLHSKHFFVRLSLSKVEYEPRKHARVADSSIPAAVELADADIEEAKKEWEELLLSDED